MMQRMRQGFRSAAAVCAIALFTAAVAQAQESPEALVKRVSEDVIATIKSDPLVQAGNQARVREVMETKLLPNFDFARMTALAMGRNWRAATRRSQRLNRSIVIPLLFRAPACRPR